MRFHLKISTASVLKLLGASRPRRFFLPIYRAIPWDDGVEVELMTDLIESYDTENVQYSVAWVSYLYCIHATCTTARASHVRRFSLCLETLHFMSLCCLHDFCMIHKIESTYAASELIHTEGLNYSVKLLHLLRGRIQYGSHSPEEPGGSASIQICWG